LAPLTYGTLESLRKWSDPSRINVNWHTMAELLDVLESRPLAVNFGTLVGHSTVRRALVGEALRELTKNEAGVFARTLTEAMEQGAFGLSTGLAYVHAKNTPYAEISALAEIVAKFGGVYATHLRDNMKGLRDAVHETVRIAQERNVKTIISHFMPLRGGEAHYKEALAIINGLPASTDLRFDVYPFDRSLVPIYTFLPQWAQNGGLDVMLTNVNDEWLVARIRKDMPQINEDNFVIAQAPGNDFLVGKSLREVREMYGMQDARDALIKLMATTEMKSTVLYRNLNGDLVMDAIKSPRSFVASNAPSFGANDKKKHVKSERTVSTFTRFLSLAADHGLMPLNDAIRKITAEPAQKFGLAKRGVIKEGNCADFACFKAGGGPVEVRFTVVNGTPVYVAGEFAEIFPGKVLRHK
jgi:N-acyl-D-amino-acid deacylase